MHRGIGACLLALGLSGCGGGSAPVELTIEFGSTLTTANPTIVLVGPTFIPSGSACPASSEFIIIGSFGPHTITASNATSGQGFPGFLQTPWVCNAGSDTLTWASNPVTLSPGPNVITVTMSDSQRSSSATITVTRTGP